METRLPVGVLILESFTNTKQVKKTFIILIITSIIFFTIISCETFVDINVPPIAQKPVLNCLFTENKTFSITLGLSGQVNDTSATLINNAEMLLYGNDLFIEQLQNKGNGIYVSVSKAQKGVMYSIKASIEGYETIQVSDSLPQMVSISNLHIKKKAIIDIYGGKYDQVSFNIHDSSGVNNFYETDVFKIAENPHYGRGFVSPVIDTISLTFKERDIAYWLIDDPALTNEFISGWNNSISFTDEIFDGKIYPLKLPIDNDYNLIEYHLLFNVGSKNYYLYKSRIEKHLFNQGGFLFDELMLIDGGNPVEMFSNIENGYGIFAGYLSQEILITDIRE